MFWTLLSFFLYLPLFLAAFVLGIIAIAQSHLGQGIPILLLSVVVPLVIGLGLGAYRTQGILEQAQIPTTVASTKAHSSSPATEEAITGATRDADPTTEARSENTVQSCLEIASFDSSVLSSNDVFAELAWKVDVANSCDFPFHIRVTFNIYDKDDFELDSDSLYLYMGMNEIAKARDQMLASPSEKAQRISKHEAVISEL